MFSIGDVIPVPPTAFGAEFTSCRVEEVLKNHLIVYFEPDNSTVKLEMKQAQGWRDSGSGNDGSGNSEKPKPKARSAAKQGASHEHLHGVTVLSEYELQRAATIEENKAKLVALGIHDDIAACRKPKKPKRQREEKPTREPTRGSRRLSGEAALEPELSPEALEALLDDEKPAGLGDRLKRASTAPRLTPEQSAKLNALEDQSAAPLTDEEVTDLEEVRKYLSGNSSGNWKSHKSKGTSLWAEKRQLLDEAKELYAIRWPSYVNPTPTAGWPADSAGVVRHRCTASCGSTRARGRFPITAGGSWTLRMRPSCVRARRTPRATRQCSSSSVRRVASASSIRHGQPAWACCFRTRS